MSRSSQKEIEYTHVLKFQRLCLDCPQGEIRASEAPDFLIAGAIELLGIEHTQFISGSRTGGQPLVARESLFDRLAKRVDAELNVRGARGVQVTLAFLEGRRLTNQDLDTTSTVVARAAVKALGESNDRIIQLSVREVPELSQTPIREIDLRRLFNTSTARCGYAYAGFQLTPAVSALQATMYKKESLVSDYRGACDELWLLIVADNSTLSRGVNLEDFPIEHQFVSSFDRVFFFGDMRWVREMKLLHPTQD